MSTLGKGEYTVDEIALILDLPYSKSYAWMNRYWSHELEKDELLKRKTTTFHVLIEAYTVHQLREQGVSMQHIRKVQKRLSKEYETPFPFAKQEVLKSLYTDSKNIFKKYGIHFREVITRQLSFAFIGVYLKKITFDDEGMAKCFYPLGKEKNIIVDPEHRFGAPVIKGTNTSAWVLYDLYQAGESKACIADLYNVDTKSVKDAIKLFERREKRAAA